MIRLCATPPAQHPPSIGVSRLTGVKTAGDHVHGVEAPADPDQRRRRLLPLNQTNASAVARRTCYVMLNSARRQHRPPARQIPG
jgi:hypothetical protein